MRQLRRGRTASTASSADPCCSRSHPAWVASLKGQVFTTKGSALGLLLAALAIKASRMTALGSRAEAISRLVASLRCPAEVI